VRPLVVELTELFAPVEFDSAADARTTRMYGPGLESATVAVPTSFTIEARNIDRQLIRVGGEPFLLRVEHSSAVDHPLLQTVIDNDDGTYTAKYTPVKEGPHTVRVLLRGEHVAQSPVTVQVRPAPVVVVPQAERAIEGVDDLGDLRALLDAISREIRRDKRNLDKLPDVTRTVEKIGVTNEKAKVPKSFFQHVLLSLTLTGPKGCGTRAQVRRRSTLEGVVSGHEED
jgi:hypothetical protein